MFILCISILFSSLASTSHATVWCGGHKASKCSECSSSYGEAWCSIDCVWKNDQCVNKSVQCGSGNVIATEAASCNNCPSDESSCTSPDCSFNSVTGLCRKIYSGHTRSASVFLLPQIPGGVSEPNWLFSKMRITASSDVTQFSMNGNSFGYGGVEQISNSPYRGRIFFSIWDQEGCHQGIDSDCAEIVACGTGVSCSSFNGERSGQNSFLVTHDVPQVNSDYYMMTQAKKVGSNKVEYTGYFLTEESGEWKFLSKILVSTGDLDWWHTGLYNFIEEWDATSTLDERSALFGPHFLSDDGATFHQVTETIYSHGLHENHEHVNAYNNGSAVGISTGGRVEQVASRGQTFAYEGRREPSVLEDFKSYISCLNDAATAHSIEECLNPSGARMFPCMGFGNEGKIEFILKMHTDNFGTETEWKIEDMHNNQTVEESFAQYASNSFFEHRMCLDDSCYKFTISDKFDDGMCCNQGRGNYTISFNGVATFMDGNFTSKEITKLGCDNVETLKPITNNPSWSPSTSPSQKASNSPTSSKKPCNNACTNRLSKKMSWKKKCAKSICNGCKECEEVPLKCKKRCTKRKELWEKKCQWKVCAGCAHCKKD